MTNLTKIAAGLAGLAAMTAVASPASAQSYPYGQSGGGVLGQILNSVVGGGYGQYPQGNYGYAQVDSRAAVQRCAVAVEQRLNASVQGGQYGYGNNGYDNRYGQQYGYNTSGGARVVGIDNVERRNKGALRVHGLAVSGQQQAYGYNQGYQGQYGQYPNQYGNQYGNQAYASGQADLYFSCKVDARGAITDLSFNRIRQQGYYRR